MQRLSARVVVVVLCLSLLAYGAPASSRAPRTGDTWICYPMEDGAQVCAATKHDEKGTAEATYYYSSPKGSMVVEWKRGSNPHIASYHIPHNAKVKSKSSSGLAISLDDPLGDGDFGCTGDDYNCNECSDCIARQDYLCQNVHDAEARAAVAEGEALLIACSPLVEIPILYVACIVAATLVVIEKVNAADARLDQCKDQSPRNCRDSQGRQCRR